MGCPNATCIDVRCIRWHTTPRSAFVTLEIVSRKASDDVEVFRDDARVGVDPVEKPAKQLAQKPELISLLEGRNTLTLMNRPEIQCRISNR
jgi:hypothetical protein